MADILPFRSGKRRPATKVSTLCREGHHSWQLETKSRFDVKQGKLVTIYRCRHCTAVKTTAQ